jgi:hypothetical protein
VSTDIFASCEHCGASRFSWNITHNLGGMFREAGIVWRNWEGQKASRLLPIAEFGLELLLADPERFRKFEATNGWGSYPDAVRALSQLVDELRRAKDATIGVSL